MRVTARITALLLALTGLAVSPAVFSPAIATPEQQKGNAYGRHGSARSETQAQASPSPTSSGTPSASPSPSPSSTPPSKPDGDPAGPATTLDLDTSVSEILVEVGGTFRYTVTVRNTGDEPLEGVIVVDEVAPEVDVVSVPISDDVDAVQLGRSPRGEDIVWNVGHMRAGEEITLEWTARAASAGDLMAVNEVSAEAEKIPSRSASSTTFLASDEGVRAANPKAAPVTKKVVVLGTRLVRAPSSDGAALPITGMEVIPYLLAAAVLIGLGSVLNSRGRRRSRVAIGAMVALLVLSACVTSAPQDEAAEPRDEEVTETEPEPDPKPSDQVLGKRLTRSPEEAAQDEVEGEDVTEATEEVAEAAPEFITEQVREVKTVVVPPEELVSGPLASRDGDNQMSFDWDLDTRTIPTAASSVMFFPEATTELMTSLEVEGDAISVVVTLTNISDEPIDVSGRLVHIVSGADGEIAEFTSEPIDMILNPDGDVKAEFSYLLPTGSYSAASAFRAN